MRTTSAKRLTHGRRDKWQTDGVLIAKSLPDAPLNFAEIFNNTRPVECEIGSGKGAFLLARAAARPEVNVLGIEYAHAYAAYTADRVRRAGLTNVRMLACDAGKLFDRFMPAGSLLRLHIYFPDPWPKRKHHRRRLIQPPFLADARKALAVGGELIVVTDHLGYYQQIGRVLNRAEGFARIPLPKMADADGEIVGTNFERKYIAQGRPFFGQARLKYRR